MSWTKAQKELVFSYWKDGQTASQIAANINSAFRTAYTRNAIIGVIHRAGLSGRIAVSPKGPRSRFPARPRTQRPSLFRSTAPPPLEPSPMAKPEPYEEVDVPLDKRVGVAGLEVVQCRWPIGDPQDADFHFCHHEKIPGVPYCEKHARAAYQAPSVRPRKPANKPVPISARTGQSKTFEKEDA